MFQLPTSIACGILYNASVPTMKLVSTILKSVFLFKVLFNIRNRVCYALAAVCWCIFRTLYHIFISLCNRSWCDFKMAWTIGVPQWNSYDIWWKSGYKWWKSTDCYCHSKWAHVSSCKSNQCLWKNIFWRGSIQDRHIS